jgi:hypothetical protein
MADPSSIDWNVFFQQHPELRSVIQNYSNPNAAAPSAGNGEWNTPANVPTWRGSNYWGGRAQQYMANRPAPADLPSYQMRGVGQMQFPTLGAGRQVQFNTPQTNPQIANAYQQMQPAPMPTFPQPRQYGTGGLGGPPMGNLSMSGLNSAQMGMVNRQVMDSGVQQFVAPPQMNDMVSLERRYGGGSDQANASMSNPTFTKPGSFSDGMAMGGDINQPRYQGLMNAMNSTPQSREGNQFASQLQNQSVMAMDQQSAAMDQLRRQRAFELANSQVANSGGVPSMYRNNISDTYMNYNQGLGM